MKNLLIVGSTSGIMMNSLNTFLKKNYNIFATYNNKKSLKNIPKNIIKNRKIKFIKLDLLMSDKEILKVLNKNKVRASKSFVNATKAQQKSSESKTLIFPAIFFTPFSWVNHYSLAFSPSNNVCQALSEQYTSMLAVVFNTSSSPHGAGFAR